MIPLPDPKDRAFWRKAEKAYDQGPYFLAKLFCEHLELTTVSWNLRIQTLSATQDYIEHMFCYFVDTLASKYAPRYSKAFLRGGLDLYKKQRRLEIEAERDRQAELERERQSKLKELKKTYTQKQIQDWHSRSVLTYFPVDSTDKPD